MNYVRFDPPRKLAEYRGQFGHEVGALALSPMALDALAEATVSGGPPSLVVIGRYEREEDDVWFLDLGVPTTYIEVTTDYRWDREANRLRLICPECGLKDGKHSKACSR